MSENDKGIENPIKLPKEAYELAARMEEKKKVYHLSPTHYFMNANRDKDEDDDYFFGLTTDTLWEFL